MALDATSAFRLVSGEAPMSGNPPVAPGAALGSRSNWIVTGMIYTLDVDDFPHSTPMSQSVSVAVSAILYRPGVFVASTSVGALVGAADVPSLNELPDCRMTEINAAANTAFITRHL